jgi:hypothetical protein
VAHTPHSWARDGAHLLFSAEKASQHTLWTLTVKDGQSAAFGDVASREAVFSPDGRWVAYYLREGTSNVIYLEPFPRTSAKYRVPVAGGHPYWSPKGDELFMNSAAGRNAIIAVTTAPRVSFGRPVDFPRTGRAEGNPGSTRRNVDMMPDGGHVLGVHLPGQESAAQIVVVLNWFTELQQLVPTR